MARLDIGVNFAQIDDAVVLVSRPLAIGDLQKKDQFALAAAGFQVSPIEFDFNLCRKPLMERKRGARNTGREAEGSRCRILKPLIERNGFKGGVQNSGRAGRLSGKKGSEEKS